MAAPAPTTVIPEQPELDSLGAVDAVQQVFDLAGHEAAPEDDLGVLGEVLQQLAGVWPHEHFVQTGVQQDVERLDYYGGFWGIDGR